MDPAEEHSRSQFPSSSYMSDESRWRCDPQEELPSPSSTRLPQPPNLDHPILPCNHLNLDQQLVWLLLDEILPVQKRPLILWPFQLLDLLDPVTAPLAVKPVWTCTTQWRIPCSLLPTPADTSARRPQHTKTHFQSQNTHSRTLHSRKSSVPDGERRNRSGVRRSEDQQGKARWKVNRPDMKVKRRVALTEGY